MPEPSKGSGNAISPRRTPSALVKYAAKIKIGKLPAGLQSQDTYYSVLAVCHCLLASSAAVF